MSRSSQRSGRPSLAAAIALAAFSLPGAVAAAAATLAAGEPVPIVPSPSPSDPRIHIVARDHPDDGKLDELRVVCTDGDDEVDVALPRRWVDFIIRHLDSNIEVDGDEIDLEILWEAIEELRPGEEILIEERGGAQVRIWIE